MLPKISHPTFEVVIPSTKKKVKMRLMLVKEEKILLMAKESESQSDIARAVKQVVNNCLLDEKVDINKLAIFDIEYLFLKLRANSIDNVTKVSYKDTEDDTVYDFDIKLDEIEVKFPEGIDKTIKADEKIGIIMKYPEAFLMEEKQFSEISDPQEIFNLLVHSCIDKIYNGTEVINVDTVGEAELTEFIDSLNIETYQKIKSFLVNLPSMVYEIKYTNKLGNERQIVLRSLTDFFTLR
jgi:T4 bacteriophage base plate protein